MATITGGRTVLLGLLCGLAAAPAAEPIRVMLLDGESGGAYHDWRATSGHLRRMLVEARIFAVDVVTAPPAGADVAGFRPDWGRYAAVVANYDAPDERWGAELRRSLEDYVRGGGGLVAVHAADNAFPGWKAYNEMIGIGGWRGRDERAGPFWYYQGDRLVSDPAPGPAGTHGARLPFQIRNRGAHPVTRGLPGAWMHAGDELYARLRGPGIQMTVIATAYSDPANKGSGRDEPVLVAVRFGRGRVFHTTLGHDIAAMSCAGFITTIQRGTEWAATGRVKQAVPSDFPAADQVRTRREYAPPPGSNSSR